MTTIADLVDTEPVATNGIATSLVHDTGVWRWVVELADPSAGSSVEWFDITDRIAGYQYTRGADQPFGRYRASVATITLHAPDDAFAPWNPDTSPRFGTHVELGPGLLIRGSFIRVVAAAVAEWQPRWTLKVETWGDASYARGQFRLHTILARDTLTSLVGVPIAASSDENWSERVDYILTQAGWVYGSTIYGALFTAGPTDVLTVPGRTAQLSAVQELDVTLDPAGCVWFTNRKGQLIVRPSPIDTFHADKFTAGATGTPWNPDEEPVPFTYYASDDDGTLGHVAYAIEQPDSFGIERSEEAIINHVVRVAPGGTFDDDDPTSIQRFDRKTSSQSWITENDQVAADILAAGAWREYQARPLYTTRDLHGFLPRAGFDLDFLGHVAIDHSTAEGRIAAFLNGTCRQYVERGTPRGLVDVSWDLTIILDAFSLGVSAGASLLPVEDLAFEGFA